MVFDWLARQIFWISEPKDFQVDVRYHLLIILVVLWFWLRIYDSKWEIRIMAYNIEIYDFRERNERTIDQT